MEYDRMLATLFEEEDRAREMASKLMKVSQESREASSAERQSLVAFLKGPMERHMAYEERAVFPQLDRRGLGAEVQVALRHHAMIREDAEKLAAARPGDDVSQLIFDVARRMLHHTNFEGDYIYPELTYEAWRDLMKETAG
ncbi:MAG TPA: hemerythrin domain-containing protein [Polyangium sp.]|uniref:Hemerythrin domain-containing protein n=2 Tax=Polyangium TaxID=55 RepID=A0A4U1JKQ5_9BACT|nr:MULTISPECIES: hemerythrin domain-containing protein [Polyangium]MDI1432999.1 hemerythrin domain-containing protein [Polyangium sorediatum]TKD12615.1 hemerythrin domain-containing protein [Polyangium fumosum]HVK70981.1 hemerythrin domain-containing protein [Polyangium sp.]